MADAVARPAAEEDLPRDARRRPCRSGVSSTAGPSPATASRGTGRRCAAEGLEERRAAARTRRRARGAPCRSGRRACRRAAPRTCAFRKWSAVVLGDADGERRAEPGRFGGDLVALDAGGEVVDVDHVLGPHDQVDGALQRPGGGQVALEDLARVGVDGARALGPAALHERDPGRVDLVALRGHGRGQEEHGGGTAQHRDRHPPPAQRADSATPRPTVTSVSSSAPPRRASGASGPAAWPMARLARGTPSNGKHEAQGLGQRDGGGEAEPAPAAAGSHAPRRCRGRAP